MYEVQYSTGPNNIEDLLTRAGVDTSTVQDGIAELRNGVFNAVGSPPAPPSGNRLSYAAGARGPTPMPSAYTPEALTVTFPPQLVDNDVTSRRHYLPESVARLFEALATASARRSDLAYQLAIGLTIRTLLEQNDPRDAGAGTADASGLYSHIYEYPQVIVTYAGGDDTGYSVSHDVLTRPTLVRVRNYNGPGLGEKVGT